MIFRSFAESAQFGLQLFETLGRPLYKDFRVHWIFDLLQREPIGVG